MIAIRLLTKLTPCSKYCLSELAPILQDHFLAVYFYAQATSRKTNLPNNNISAAQTVDASYFFSLLFHYILLPFYSHLISPSQPWTATLLHQRQPILCQVVNYTSRHAVQQQLEQSPAKTDGRAGMPAVTPSGAEGRTVGERVAEKVDRQAARVAHTDDTGAVFLPARQPCTSGSRDSLKWSAGRPPLFLPTRSGSAMLLSTWLLEAPHLHTRSTYVPGCRLVLCFLSTGW